MNNDTKKIEFLATDYKEQDYQFNLNLADQINEHIDVSVKESKVELVLIKEKQNYAFWSFLIEKTAKNLRSPSWLKIDFDRWQPDESSEDEQHKNPEVF